MKFALSRAVGLVCVATMWTGCGDPTQPIQLPDPSAVLPPAPSPAPSPTGGWIYLADSNGIATTLLATGARPAWSPDGQKIAFHRDGNVYVIENNGTNEIMLVSGGYPAWSPDGRQIAFSNADGISVTNADGSGHPATLIRHDFRNDTYAPWDMGVSKPSWSPDGKRIAFEHLGDGDMQPAQIYVMNADGSDVRRLTFSGGIRYAESDPCWSPDGSRIVFWSYGYGLATVPADGGEPRSAYSDFPSVAYGARPVWSADGSNISFTRRAPKSAPAVWTMSQEGFGARLLVPNAYDAAWSPNGGRIAFVSTGSR